VTCPYLVINAGKEACKRMLEDDLDGTVSDFDVKHYCKGNPIHCYYFRSPANRKLFDWRADRKEKVEVPSTTT